MVPTRVSDAFGRAGPATLLPGGQGGTFRIDDLVLKQIDDERETCGLAGVLSGLREDGFRVARPVRAIDGRWVVDGWAAWRWVEGEPGFAGREREAVEACRALHEAMASHAHPDWIGHRTSIWQTCDEIAWGERSSGTQMPPEVCDRIDPLSSRLKPIGDLPSQITHGDPGGDNVLFHTDEPPALIDISPYWRPAGYAIAMMLADGVAWEGSDPDVLLLAEGEPHLDQLLLRAVLFRLSVAGSTRGVAGVRSRRAAYDAVLRFAGFDD